MGRLLPQLRSQAAIAQPKTNRSTVMTFLAGGEVLENQGVGALWYVLPGKESIHRHGSGFRRWIHRSAG
jgi:hypothetical protein